MKNCPVIVKNILFFMQNNTYISIYIHIYITMLTMWNKSRNLKRKQIWNELDGEWLRSDCLPSIKTIKRHLVYVWSLWTTFSIHMNRILIARTKTVYIFVCFRWIDSIWLTLQHNPNFTHFCCLHLWFRKLIALK